MHHETSIHFKKLVKLKEDVSNVEFNYITADFKPQNSNKKTFQQSFQSKRW